MRILLDTHIFLWFIAGDTRLPLPVRESVRDPDTEVYLSVASVWEAVIKYQLGRLSLPEPPQTYVPRQRERHQIASLTIDEASVARLAELPPIHRDPFDRILVAHAQRYGLTVATVDPLVQRYAVPILG
jgi:PIN domain nuclease of toxin-antitoxin system